MGKKRQNDGSKIFVRALGAYNAGKDHGAWIDATQDPDDIRADIQEVLRTSPEPHEEEWAIHDYEGFGDAKLSEFADIDKVSELANLIQEHGPVFAALLNHYGGAQYLDQAVHAIEEGYQGAYDSAAGWAESFAEETGASVENYRSYIDWERVAHDAELGGDIFALEADGQVHIFWANA